jgi:hypothetical protein
MAVKSNKRTVLFFLGVVVLFLFGYYMIFPLDVSFTPEELNSILQNKQQSVVSINKKELTKHAIHKPYLNPGNLRMSDWNLQGNTVVRNTEFIRLTSDSQHQVGSMFSKSAIDAESFELELTFHVSARKSTTGGLVGDGLAIWLIDEPSPIGDVFGAQNFFNGLGIFIDTYKNGKRGQFPYVNIMLGDGKTKYDKAVDGYDTRLAGCSATQVLNPKGGETKMRLVYIKDGYISIDFNWEGKHEEWRNCVTLTDVHLPKKPYFGLSAETGDLSENVDIIENKIYGLMTADKTYVESLQELESLILNEDPVSSPKNDKDKDKGKKKTRKTLHRLRNSEKRIKERDRQLRLQKYGDADATFVKRTLGKFVAFFKYAIYSIIAMIMFWVLWTIYRVQRQKRKSKAAGLLA